MMTLTKHLQFTAIIVAVCLLNTSIGSNTDAERAALMQLVDEIEGLAAIIDRAEKAANPTSRIQFQYDWLRRDLKLVRQGIEAHFETPNSEPRQFEPLQGDYRQ